MSSFPPEPADPAPTGAHQADLSDPHPTRRGISCWLPVTQGPYYRGVPEKIRLRIGNMRKAVLVSGQAYQDPKDALNEFVSNAADASLRS